MRIEVTSPNVGVLVLEPGDRVALVSLSPGRVFVGRPQVVPSGGFAVRWSSVDRCDTFTWAALDDDDTVLGLGDAEVWAAGVTYTLEPAPVSTSSRRRTGRRR